MAILTKIGNIPLFTSIGEALAWARLNFTKGYHTHTYRGKVGYMGGETHSGVVNQRYNTVNQTTTPQAQPQPIVPQNPIPPPPPVVQPIPTPTPIPPPTPTPIQINYGSGGGGGGGGGGGY